MGSLAETNEKIKDNLNKFGLTAFEELDDKTLKRLNEIESCICDMEINSKELEKRLKDIQPNITRIISSDNVSISKKTAYNNPIIIKYIEMSIESFPDFFNERKVSKLEQNYIELYDRYNKVINNIIDDYNIEHENELLSEKINELNNKINNLKQILNEKNQEITNVKRNNKIIVLNKNKHTEGK